MRVATPPCGQSPVPMAASPLACATCCWAHNERALQTRRLQVGCGLNAHNAPDHEVQAVPVHRHPLLRPLVRHPGGCQACVVLGTRHRLQQEVGSRGDNLEGIAGAGRRRLVRVRRERQLPLGLAQRRIVRLLCQPEHLQIAECWSATALGARLLQQCATPLGWTTCRPAAATH